MIQQTVVVDPADETRNLVTTYEYTFDGHLTRMTDPEGNVTTYTYDKRSRLIRITDGAGNQINMTYTAGSTGCTSCGGKKGGQEKGSSLLLTLVLFCFKVISCPDH